MRVIEHSHPPGYGEHWPWAEDYEDQQEGLWKDVDMIFTIFCNGTRDGHASQVVRIRSIMPAMGILRLEQVCGF